MRALSILLGFCAVTTAAKADQLALRNNCGVPMSVAAATFQLGDETMIEPWLNGPQLHLRGVRTVEPGEVATLPVAHASAYLFAEKIGAYDASLAHVSTRTLNHCVMNWVHPSHGGTLRYLSKRALMPDASGNFVHAYAEYLPDADGVVRAVPTNALRDAPAADDCKPDLAGAWRKVAMTRVPLDQLAPGGGTVDIDLCPN